MEISISVSSVAWYGAIVATVSCFISALNYHRDRPRIKMLVKRDRVILNNPQYPSENVYINVTVINTGRRPINIIKAGFETFAGEKRCVILYDSFSQTRNRILTEESPTSEFFMLQDSSYEQMLKTALCVFAEDAQGNIYRKYLHPVPTAIRLKHYLTHRFQ